VGGEPSHRPAPPGGGPGVRPGGLRHAGGLPAREPLRLLHPPPSGRRGHLLREQPDRRRGGRGASRAGVRPAGRAVAALACLAVLVVVTALVQWGADAHVHLSINGGRLGATLALSALLALFHGGLAVAVAGFRPRTSVVLGIAFVVAITGM